MEFRDYLRALRRSWPLMVVLAIIGGAAGYAGGALQTPGYAATAQTYVSARSADSLSDLSLGAAYTQQAVQSYADIATTAYVLRPVIADLGLRTTPARLARAVTVSTSTTSAVLGITVDDTDPSRAASIANAVASQLRTAVVALTPGTGTRDTPTIKLTVVNPATVPTAPTNPSKILLAAGGAAAGIVIALLIGLLRELTDTRVRSAEEVQRVTDLPLLGSFRRDAETPRHPLAVLEAARTPRAEAYRTLRTNLRYVELDETAKSLVVTSSVESEGKSTTAANLALAAAKLGQRVLLVDADLRRPRMGTMFGIEDSIGLTDVLIGAVPLEDAVQRFGDSELDLLPSGAIPPNPNEQLQSRAMSELLAVLHEEYDLVVFDTPPLLAVSDAAVLGRQAGAVAIVAASGRVRRAQLEGSLQALERVDARVVGVIVTMLPRRGSDVYGYGYGAGTEQADRRRRPGRRLTTREV